jgi:Reverse transcriptase (RNA-dependent DNA polymerase)
MAAPDKQEFKEAMVKEVNSHSENVVWIVMNREDVPDGHKVLPAIWAMRQKRDIESGAVYKWKARLNIHGGKQVKGLKYWDTYAPVASWAATRVVLAIATLRQWKAKQMDFILTFPPALVETGPYMEIPTGFSMESGETNKVLKLQNNLYGKSKQVGYRIYTLLRD